MAVGVGVAICSMAYAWNSAETFEVIVSEEHDIKSLGFNSLVACHITSYQLLESI